VKERGTISRVILDLDPEEHPEPETPESDDEDFGKIESSENELMKSAFIVE